jgi:hypothetical protein
MKQKKDLNKMELEPLTQNELTRATGGSIGCVIRYSYFLAFGFATGGVGFRLGGSLKKMNMLC